MSDDFSRDQKSKGARGNLPLNRSGGFHWIFSLPKSSTNSIETKDLELEKLDVELSKINVNNQLLNLLKAIKIANDG
jgi:hypothetical protein